MKIFAGILTIILHPLILLNFGLFTILRFHPYYLSKFYENQFYTLSMFIAVNTLLMPLLSVYLLKRFRFIDDFAISNPKQRLLPYGVMVILLLFTAYQLFKIEMKGLPLVFLVSSALCVVYNILINIKFTISSHAIGAGGLVALYTYTCLIGHISEMNWLLLTAILLAGLSCWTRLLLNAHNEKQIYSGLALGFFTVLLNCVIFC